jgi:fibrillarin-like rRNA methylase
MDNHNYYTNCEIYGVKIYRWVDEYIILFEKKYNKIMSDEIMKETKIFYENLNEYNKENVKFQIYIKCESIDNNENFMIWWNISLNEFIKKFNC